MKELFLILKIMVTQLDESLRQNKYWGHYSWYDLSRIFRQYLAIFNLLDISRKERILILAPNSQAWIFLVITAMSKRFQIYILSPRESLVNIKYIISKHEINHIFTTSKLGTELLKDHISNIYSLKSIIEIGTIFTGILMDTNILYFSKYYSGSFDTNENVPEITKLSKIEIVPQLQEMDDDVMLDWASKLLSETDLYKITVFSEGVTKPHLTPVTFDGKTFEKIIEKIHLNFDVKSEISLNLDYSEWVPFVLASFSLSSKIRNESADVLFYDDVTFLHMWKDVVESKLQNRWLDTIVSLLPFLKTRLVKKELTRRLGNFKKLYILNGGKLATHIKTLLIKSKLPVYTTFGTLHNGYVSYLNEGDQLITDLGKEVVEKDGKLVLYKYGMSFRNYQSFKLESTTDAYSYSNHDSRVAEDILVNFTKIGIKIPFFKQKVKTTRYYAGRTIDRLILEDGTIMPYTAIKSIINSVRMFDGCIIKSIPGQIGLDAIIELNLQETEYMEDSDIQKMANYSIRKINKQLPKELKIKHFSILDSQLLRKTRNGNIKSFLYN